MIFRKIAPRTNSTAVLYGDMGNVRFHDKSHLKKKQFGDYIETILSGYVDISDPTLQYGLRVFVSEMNPDDALTILNEHVDEIKNMFDKQQTYSIYKLPNESNYNTIPYEERKKYGMILVKDFINIPNILVAIPETVDTKTKMMIVMKHILVPYETKGYLDILL